MRGPVKPSAGFTLVEVAVSLLIAGILGVGALYILNKAEQRENYYTTLDRMDVVVKALATYVDSAGRLPCPADPGVADVTFGWEWGVGGATIAGGRPTPSPTCQTWDDPTAAGVVSKNIGIVPFLTLGLQDKDVRDGWGNYFTYAVSPVFAQNNDDVNSTVAGPRGQDTGNVHVRCLDETWYDNREGSTQDIMSGPKAKFCCAKNGNSAGGAFGTNSDINIIFTQSDGTVTALWPNDTDAIPYNTPRDTDHYFIIEEEARDIAFLPITNTPPDIAGNTIEAPAFVLISHGDNGEGAFLGNNSRAKITGGAPGLGEIENGAGTAGGNRFDSTFTTGPRTMAAGNNHFDDILVWRTQDGIMAETGAGSCRTP